MGKITIKIENEELEISNLKKIDDKKHIDFIKSCEMTIGEFVQNVYNGLISDYDGHCDFYCELGDVLYNLENVLYSVDENKIYIDSFEEPKYIFELLDFILNMKYYGYFIKISWYNK